MILALLSWILYAFVAFGYGKAVLTLVEPWLEPEERIHPVLVILGGLAALATLTTITSFVIAISPVFSGVIFIVGLVLCWTYRESLVEIAHTLKTEISTTPWFIWAALAMILVFSMINCVIPTSQFDEGLYYTQTIRWLQEYGTVTGLGNLHAKLSFNSAWHTLCAAMGFSLSELNDLNPFLHLLIGIYALSGILAIYRKKYTLGNFMVAFLIVPTHLFTGTDMNSPAPDFVIMSLVMVVFALFIRKVESGTTDRFDTTSFFILLLGIFAVTVKLSAMPMLLLPAYLVFSQIKTGGYAKIAMAVVLGLIIMLPWLGRNVMLSGYLVYPAHQVDLFSFEWEVPHGIVALEVDETRAFSKIRKINYAQVRDMDMKTWLPYWLGEMRAGEKMVLLFLFGCTAIYLVFLVLNLKKAFSKEGFPYLYAILTLYLGVAYWFLAAPAMRFGYGYTVPVYLLVAAFVFRYLFESNWELAKKWAFPAMCMVILAFYLKGASYAAKNYLNSFQAREIVMLPSLPDCDCSATVVQGYEIRVPNGTAQCFNSPLPCSPLVMEGLELLGQDPSSGFKMPHADPETYERLRIARMKKDREILLGKDAGDFELKSPETQSGDI